MNQRITYAVIALLVLAAAIVPQAHAADNRDWIRPDVVYAPNMMGLSPGLGGNEFAFSPGISIGNVTTRQITGTIRLAIILAQFSDVPAQRTKSQIQQDYLGTDHSVAAYYLQVSYGKLTVTGDVFGWYTLPYGEAHYGRDCNAIDDSDCSGSDQSWQIAQDAATLARNDVNFTNYDYYVFVHSGNGEESSGVHDDVWSVTYLGGVWVNPCLDVQENCNQKTLTKFNVTPELEAGGSVPLGVYCHEFGHQLGLPDMYDTNTGKSRMGGWELMDKGLWNGKPPGSEPAELSSWSRNRLGWLPPSHVATIPIDSDELAKIQPLERLPVNESVSAVVVPLNKGDYYLFENREPIGNDVYLPDHGIVGYHIDENDNLFTTIGAPAAAAAFHPGDLVSKGEVTAKVVAAFSNSSFLVGFGAASNATIQQASYLTVSVVPSLGVNVRIDNQTYTTDPVTGDVTVIAQYSNETFEVSVPQTVNVQPGVRIEFHTWENGYTKNSRRILVTSNSSITATYKKQYFVSVESQYCTAIGSGWYDENSQDTVSVNPMVNGAAGIRYVFAGWAGDLSMSTNPITFQVDHPMSLTAVWTTFEWMQMSFYDPNSTNLPTTMLDSVTIRAPNGTVLMLSNLQSSSSFWFEKGTYHVLTAYVYGVDAAAGTEDFSTSPDGAARIQLELYPMTFRVNDFFFGTPLNGGTVTITLPNGQTDSASIKDGQAFFYHLPAAIYSFTISRDSSMGVSGEATLPSQSSTSVGLIVIPSLLFVAFTITVVLTTAIVLLKKRASRHTRALLTHPHRDRIYSDYWNKQNRAS